MNVNQITGAVIDSAMKVHSALGPGLLESAYKACLIHELRKRGLCVASEVNMPLIYDSLKMDVGYRIDLLVENTVVVELKAVEAIAPIH
jgi:GxxExxY protein